MNFNSLSPNYLVIQNYVQFDLNIRPIKMDLIHTETDRGNKCLIYNNFTYWKVNVLKNGDVVYRCSSEKKDGLGVIKIRNEHKNVTTKAVRKRRKLNS